MSIFFSDRTDFSEPLHLKDTLQLLCKFVRRINLHISIRKYRGIGLFKWICVRLPAVERRYSKNRFHGKQIAKSKVNSSNFYYINGKFGIY